MNFFEHDRWKAFLMWILNLFGPILIFGPGDPVFILFLGPRKGSKYNIQKRVLFYSLFSSIIISSLSAHHRGSKCLCVRGLDHPVVKLSSFFFLFFFLGGGGGGGWAPGKGEVPLFSGGASNPG